MKKHRMTADEARDLHDQIEARLVDLQTNSRWLELRIDEMADQGQDAIAQRDILESYRQQIAAIQAEMKPLHRVATGAV